MTTRREFVKTAAMAPLAGLISPGLGTLQLGPSSTERSASETLYAGKPMSYWLTRLHRWDDEIQLADEFEDVTQDWVFPNFGQPAVPSLIEALTGGISDDARVQLEFLASPETVRLLVQALKHENSGIRTGAISALLGIATHRESRPRLIEPLRQGLPAITEALHDGNPEVVHCADMIVNELGPSFDPTMPIPLDRLNDDDTSSRNRAVQRLGYLRSRAKEVVPLLEAKLRDPDHSVRRAAAMSLSRLDPAHPSIIPVVLEGVTSQKYAPIQWSFERLDLIVPKVLPAMLEVLKTGRPEVRASIAECMGWGEADTVLPVLLELQEDDSPEVRRQAVGSLLYFDASRVVMHVIRALGDGDREVRYKARQVLIQPPLAAKAVPYLIEALNSGSPSVRVSAALAVDDMGQEATKALPALRQNLDHAEPRVRLAAALVVARIQPDEDGTVPVTGEGRRYSGFELSEEAIDILLQLGSNFKVIVPKLSNGLIAASSRARSAGLLMLLGRLATPALPRLLALLRDRALCGSGPRYRVQQTLANIGREAVQPLMSLLEDDAVLVRTRAIRTLGLMGARARLAVPALITRAENGTLAERVLTAQTLGRIGPAAAAAVPALRSLLRDRDRAVLRETIDALGSMGCEAESGVPDLGRLLLDSGLNMHFKWWVADALTAIGGASVPVLIRALKHPDEEVRESVAGRIGCLGRESQVVVSILTDSLFDADVGVRSAAARSLRSIGPKAATAVPRLKRLLDDPCVVVRDNAETAITAIEVTEPKPSDEAGRTASA